MTPLLVLGIDTATWTAAVGVSRGETVLAEVSARESRSHTVSLPGLVERALADASLRIEDVEGLAVSIGPGSFTGLRISLALAKGIAFAGGVPLVGVPTLEALACVAAAPGATVCAALDARKREVYAALFAVGDDGAPRRLTDDMVLAPDALARRLPPGCVIVGDAADVYGDVLRPCGTILPFATHHPRGGTVARLGARRLAAGEAANPGTLEPVYVRASEAELARAASQGLVN